MISSPMKNVGQFSIGQLHCPTNLRIKRTICKIWLPIAEQKIPKSHAIAIQCLTVSLNPHSKTGTANILQGGGLSKKC